MKLKDIAKTVAAIVLSCSLVACGAHSLTLVSLDEASGVKVTAENAGEDNVASSEVAIVVEDGDVIVISPFLDKGSFNLTITEHDDGTVVYDDIAEGKVMFQAEAVPGTYDVQVSGNNATGWMTVFAQSADELDAQNESLAEALEAEGVDADAATDGE